jgi:hypothetical protein
MAGDGTLYEMELIYYPTTANAAGYKESPTGRRHRNGSVTDLGDDKELYRYNFIIKNHRDADDYSRFVALGKAWALPAGSAALDAATRQLMDIDDMDAGLRARLVVRRGRHVRLRQQSQFPDVHPAIGRKISLFPRRTWISLSRAGRTASLVGDSKFGQRS